MLFLTAEGWFDSLSALGVVIFTILLGIYCIFAWRQNKIKLLLYIGLGCIFFALLWTGSIIDIISVLSTGNNTNDATSYIGFLSYIWWFPYSFMIILTLTELAFTNRKKLIIIIFTSLNLLIELYIFIDPIGSFIYRYPENPGDGLIYYSINSDSPAGILYSIMIFLILFGWGAVFLIRAISTEGIVRKKFIYMLIGLELAQVSGILESLTNISYLLPIARVLLLVGYWLLYLALREEPEKTEKIKEKKDFKIEGDLFHIIKRPSQITEEEVSLYRERKICLVCKGKVGGFIFMCKFCDALYCGKCAEALAGLENQCWACDAPIDESKPLKPFEKEDVKITIQQDKDSKAPLKKS